MTTTLSPRLAEIVDSLPLQPDSRVLEIGCGPGAAARAVAARLTTGHILAVDRSATAVAQVRTNCAAEIASGRMSVRHVAAEDFVLEPGEDLFDIAFAVRVGALDGRHPEKGRLALQRITAALSADGRLYIDGGRPLREILPIPSADLSVPSVVKTGGSGSTGRSVHCRREADRKAAEGKGKR